MFTFLTHLSGINGAEDRGNEKPREDDATVIDKKEPFCTFLNSFSVEWEVTSLKRNVRHFPRRSAGCRYMQTVHHQSLRMQKGIARGTSKQTRVLILSCLSEGTQTHVSSSPKKKCPKTPTNTAPCAVTCSSPQPTALHHPTTCRSH